MLLEELLNEKNWSQAVTDGPARTYARKGTHTGTAEEIVAEYKRKGVSPKGLGSAIRMLTFYINRAGKNLKNGPAIRKARRMLQAELKAKHAKEDKKKD
jgi:tRNA(adenine34) deaminase